MKDQFDIASGSVTGKDHRHDGRNNHDGSAVKAGSDHLVAVVTDGCGKSKHSEVGAKIGARLIVQAISTIIARHGGNEEFLERVRQDVLAQLRVLAMQLGDSLSEVVTDFFLFTTVGMIMDRRLTTFFSLGDGFIAVNGTVIELGPFAQNRPPYLSYGLVATTLDEGGPGQFRFKLDKVMPTNELDSFLLGTDGVAHLIHAAGEAIPGKDELVGPVSQFWEQPRYFANPDNVRRRLTLANREYLSPDCAAGTIVRQGGHLSDDTTLIVGRRKEVTEQ